MAFKFLAALSVVLILAGWVALFGCGPSNMRSMFRYKMWRIRDQVVDQMRHKKLPRVECVTDIQSTVESSIRCSDRFTVFGIALMPPPSRKWVEDRRSAVNSSYALLTAEQKKLVDEHRKAVYEAYSRQLAFGSLSGWLIGIVISPVIILLFLARQFKNASLWLIQYIESRIAVAHKDNGNGGDLTACVG